MTNHPEFNRVDRVFLDANILYSAAYKDTSALRKLWELVDVVLLTSFYAVDEAHRNLAIDKPGQIESLERLIAAMTVVGDPLTGFTLPPRNRPCGERPPHSPGSYGNTCYASLDG